MFSWRSCFLWCCVVLLGGLTVSAAESTSKPCPGVECFFDTTEDTVDCVETGMKQGNSSSTSSNRSILCLLTSQQSPGGEWRVTLGKGEAIRCIKPHVFSKWPKTVSALVTHLNLQLDMVHLDANSLNGFPNLRQVLVFHVLHVESNAFENLTHLEHLQFQRALPKTEFPSYLSLSPQILRRKMVTTSLQITSCHRCVRDEGRVILLLESRRNPHSSLDIVEPSVCANVTSGRGCANSTSPSDSDAEMTEPAVPSSISTTPPEQDQEDPKLPQPDFLMSDTTLTVPNSNSIFSFDNLLPIMTILSGVSTVFTMGVIVFLVLIWRRYRNRQRHEVWSRLYDEFYSQTPHLTTVTPSTVSRYSHQNPLQVSAPSTPSVQALHLNTPQSASNGTSSLRRGMSRNPTRTTILE